MIYFRQQNELQNAEIDHCLQMRQKALQMEIVQIH